MCVLACSAHHALRASDLQGIVTFAGLPVPGATVTATQAGKQTATVTDQDGIYRLPALADGNWTIEVEMQGFVSLSREVTVPAAPEAPTPVWELTMKSVSELTQATTGVATRPAPSRTPVPPEAPGGEAAGPLDGFVVNGSVNNAAVSPFAQPRAFGNNRPQAGARYSGSLGLFAGGSRFDARPFSFGDRPSARPAYQDLRVLGTFGGPVKLPRLNPNAARFFIGYQGSREHAVHTESAVMPTLRERQGDFSRSVDSVGRPLQIRDPRSDGLVDVIPQALLSPQATALLEYFPAPNQEGDGRFNFQAPVVRRTRQDNVQFRWNHTAGRNLFSGTAAYQRTGVAARSIFGFETDRRDSGVNSTVSWNRRLTRTLAVRLRHQYTRLSNRVTPHFAHRSDVSGEAGIAGNDRDPANWGPPRIVLPTIATLSDAPFQWSRAQTQAAGVEAYLNRGRHNITLGGNLRRHATDVVSQQDPRGTLTFTGAVTGVPLADFLLGVPTTVSIGFGNADKFFRSTSFDAYITDDARLTPTLTATFGLRWEYEAPVTEAKARLVNLDAAPGFTAVAPVLASDPVGAVTNRSFSTSLVRPDRMGFQPRLAIAWRPVPGSSLVVRAGYGVYRNTGVYLPIATLLAQQPPLSKTFSVLNNPSDLRTLENAFLSDAPTISNTFAVDPDFRVSYAQNWQVSVQRDLPASLLVTASYLGSRGSRLPQQFLPNTYPTGAVNPCSSCPAGFVYLTSTGTSSRHAGRILLRRRLRNGLSASAQHTIARAIDDASTFSSASLSGASVAQNWLDLDGERAPSDFDQRHQLAVQFEYTTGAGRSGALMTGWRGALLKGWTVTSQLSAGSGLPVTPVYLAPVSGTGIIGLRPDLSGAPVDERPSGAYLNPAAYAPPARGRWGTTGRNSVTGPAQFTWDASVARPFALGERVIVEWRLDVTNVLNRVTYAAINTLVGSPQFGLPTLANPMRKAQTSLRLRF
jgi:hypothetical protein